MSVKKEDTGKAKVPSEEEVGQKWDRCISDFAIKTGAGLAVGTVFSLVLFKRRAWPIAFGAGLGSGCALSNCNHDFRRVSSVFLKPVEPSNGYSSSSEAKPEKPSDPEKSKVETEKSETPSSEQTPNKSS